MSKPIPPGIHLPEFDPETRLHLFATRYRREVNPVAIAWFRARVRECGLNFNDAELTILAALNTPDKVQKFLNEEIYYNNDHASVELDETVMPPRQVLRTGLAHCFEGALFAYAVNFLHRHNPCWVLLEATQDSEHNLVVHQDPRSGLYGCNAHSAFPHLDGRPAEFHTIRDLGQSYVPYYYSDRTHNPSDLTLVGYSEPFDLIARFGTDWIGSDKPLWDIYYTYVNDSVRFHFFDSPEATHLYPVAHALKENWIRMDASGKPFVSTQDLPEPAQNVWHAFWRVFGANDGRRAQGEAREIEKQFVALTGTTPIDLDDNASDLQYFLAAGYRVEHIVRK